MKVLIMSGGEKPSKETILEYANKSDIIIGVDGGCEYLLEVKKTPDYIVGDFDTISKENLETIEKNKVRKYQYNKEKDYTDSELAFILAFELGATEITFQGAIGGRFDHTLGSIGLLKNALRNGVFARIIDDNNKIFILNKSDKLKKDKKYKYISFLAYDGKVENFNIIGAKYEISGYKLEVGDNRTISNEFLGDSISIDFTSGNVIVVYSKD